MSYCSQSDIILAKSDKILKNITDDVNATSLIAGVITAVIERADGVIDGYLRKAGYETLPLTTVPVIIKDLSIRISVYYLYQRSHSVVASVKDDFDFAMEQLTMIADKEIIIDGDVSETSGVTIGNVFDGQVFGQDTLT
jgi:phage gp36-like protein